MGTLRDLFFRQTKRKKRRQKQLLERERERERERANLCRRVPAGGRWKSRSSKRITRENPVGKEGGKGQLRSTGLRLFDGTIRRLLIASQAPNGDLVLRGCCAGVHPSIHLNPKMHPPLNYRNHRKTSSIRPALLLPFHLLVQCNSFECYSAFDD